MTKDDFSHLLDEIQSAEREVRKAGQAEYAHTDLDAFDNFNRLAISLNLSREKVLLVYLMKHLDGIISYINGHKSQREDIRGRIKDARMYLALLWGMIDENQDFPPLLPDRLGKLELDPETKPAKWKCKTCGCLWRDNQNGTVSLFDPYQSSCSQCELKPTSEACVAVQ